MNLRCFGLSSLVNVSRFVGRSFNRDALATNERLALKPRSKSYRIPIPKRLIILRFPAGTACNSNLYDGAKPCQRILTAVSVITTFVCIGENLS